MKKHLIYTGMFLAAIGFSACNEDLRTGLIPSPIPRKSQRDS